MSEREPITISGLPDTNLISDGYHTFGELYEHRHALWIALCWLLERYRPGAVWRSKVHSDGSLFFDWFLLGYREAPGKQITYHMPMSMWDETRFANTLDRAPEWDGHTSADVLKRLRNL